jgi:hypothetical protein
MADEKLLKRMRASKAGWGWNDLDRLYGSFGFDKRDRGKHSVFTHPEFPRELRATIARHRSLPIGYISTAVKMIDRLRELRGEENGP